MMPDGWKLGCTYCLINIAAFCLLARCWILRLPCKTEGTFDIKQTNKALERHVITTLTTTLESCIEECIFKHGCKSINFIEDGWNNCELNNETRRSAKDGGLAQRVGWSYYASNQSTRLVGSMCKSLNPCKHAYCIDQCTCPGYRCTECEGAYEQSYGWYCLNGENGLWSDSKLNAKVVGSSPGHIYPLLVDNVKIPSSTNCIRITGSKNYIHIGLDRRALIYAVAVQGFKNMVNTAIRITFHDQEGTVEYPACVDKGDMLTYENQYKRFVCRDNTMGTSFWLEPFPASRDLEICEVEVFGVLI